MAIDLKNFSPKELEALIANASAQLGAARTAVIKAARQKIDALLEANNLSIHDVYPTRGKKAVVGAGAGKSGAVAPKYRSPEDPSITWSGRGRAPEWFKKALKRRGVTAETLFIDGSSAPAAPTKRAAAAKKAVRKGAKRVVRKRK
jgi:DNA-binding protein H-NS